MEQQAMVALRMVVLEKNKLQHKNTLFFRTNTCATFCKKLMKKWGFMISKV